MLKARGRSYYSLARDAKINPSIISRMKQHKIKGITFEVLDRICAVLECEPSDLIVRVADKKTKGRK